MLMTNTTFKNCLQWQYPISIHDSFSDNINPVKMFTKQNIMQKAAEPRILDGLTLDQCKIESNERSTMNSDSFFRYVSKLGEI